MSLLYPFSLSCQEQNSQVLIRTLVETCGENNLNYPPILVIL